MKIDRKCEVTVVYSEDEFRTVAEGLRKCFNQREDRSDEASPFYDKLVDVVDAMNAVVGSAV